jgi:hypothetical protein
MSKYIPQHLEKWYERVNYSGANFDGYYVAIWRLMRCSPAERSNYNYVKAHLEDSGEPVEVVTFTDAVYTYRYYVLVPETSTKALRMADMFAKRIQAKGSLDPDGEAMEDLRGVKSAWKNSKLLAKIRMCSEAGVSIFAARREEFPTGVNGLKIYQTMNETDGQAEALLEGDDEQD